MNGPSNASPLPDLVNAAMATISLRKAPGSNGLSPEHFYYSTSNTLVDLLTLLF